MPHLTPHPHTPHPTLHAIRALTLSFLLLWLAQTAVAQQPITDDQVNEVAKGLYCPICESTPLDVCPTQACIDWRAQIRDLLAHGQTKEQIYTYFAQRFGDGVLAEPPRRGANLILWLFPIGAVLVGGFFFTRYLRELKTAAADNKRPSAPPAPSLTHPPAPGQPALPPVHTPHPDYISRIEAELRGDN